MVYLGHLKCDFKEPTLTIFSILHKINILCVEFLKLLSMKFLINLIRVLHLEISQNWLMSDFKTDLVL